MSQKSILITGCSSGIGLETALHLREAGWQVIASCRSLADCDTLRDTYGFETVRIDYENSDSINAGFSEALSLTNCRLDALFNNGAYAVPGAVEDLPTDALRAIFEANVFGWHSLTCAALKVMRAQGYGRIIQNSSVLGFAALRYRGAYNATKFALEGLTDTMRLELRGSPIQVILIEPGPIRTEIRRNSWPHFQKWISVSKSMHRKTYEAQLIPTLVAKDSKPQFLELMPIAVAKTVNHALTTKRPKARYRITWATSFMMVAKRLLSTALMDKLASRL